jgi:hypothetical protein
MDILKDFVLHNSKNLTLVESGMDSKESCLESDVFDWWPEQVIYKYNRRGYRDQEWPEDFDSLSQSVWCIGDSFTVGLGCDYENIWPTVLENKLGRRCIKVAMDGASNQWISRKAVRIIEEINPDIIVLHWSHTHRREDPDTSKLDELRRLRCDEQDNTLISNLNSWAKSVESVRAANKKTKIIHSFIPNWSGEPWEYYTTQTKQPVTNKVIDDLNIDYLIPEFKQIDVARDSYHYFHRTATFFVDKIINQLNR